VLSGFIPFIRMYLTKISPAMSRNLEKAGGNLAGIFQILVHKTVNFHLHTEQTIRMGRNGGILSAGSRQISNGDILITLSAGGIPGYNLP